MSPCDSMLQWDDRFLSFPFSSLHLMATLQSSYCVIRMTAFTHFPSALEPARSFVSVLSNKWDHLLHFLNIAMMIPVQVSLFQSCSSIRSVIAAGTRILSPRAAGDRPCQRWPQLQNPGQPSPRQSLTFCSASWCMVIQNLIYKSQRKIWIMKKKKQYEAFHTFKILYFYLLWLCVACSPWDRDIFDFFEVQINYLQVPSCQWRRDIWRSNQRTNQQNEAKVTSDMLFVLLYKALTFGVDIFKGHLAWWKSPDHLIGWKKTGAVLASGWGGTQTSSEEHVWPTLIVPNWC